MSEAVAAWQAGLSDLLQQGNPVAAAHGRPQSAETVRFAEVEVFPDFERVCHGALFSLRLSNNTTDVTHALHRFPAKFVPQVPRWALTQFSGPSSTVLDPFMGSGTTLVEVLLNGGHGFGIDIDPLARLISRAKTEMPAPARIRELGARLATSWQPAADLVPPMLDLRDFDHWFSERTWRDTAGLLRTIQTLPCGEPERRFVLAVFSSVLRWVSNADDQSQKTYVSGTLPKSPPAVREAFWRSFHRAVAGLEALHRATRPGAHARVLDDADARAIPLPAGSVDLIVTSPPYLDSVDYMYNFMLEYFWLGPLLGVPTRRAFNVRRREYLGAKSPHNGPADAPDTIRDLVASDHISEERRRAAHAYFSGMAQHFREANRVLRADGRYVLVVGNSQTQSGILPVHDCLIRLAAQQGLRLEKAFGYRVRRHYMKFPRAGRGGIILIDWVIVLQKASGDASPPARLPLPWITLSADAVAH